MKFANVSDRSGSCATSTTQAPVVASADLHFYFDPICPFAWMTSTWVRVMAAREYAVDWRFISLRLVNAARRQGLI